ncbi:MAG: hypothetical protein IPL39_06835 [Opitutaceae bacterium]|nr:hypothetical protein [Opitutaceae bacterium]
MNTPSPESPRLVCRVVRWWTVLTEASASGPDAEPAGHRARCPACRAYFASHAAVETRLRHDAPAQKGAVPTGLEQRIAGAVRRAQVPAPRPQRRAIPLWAAGLGTAAVALALVVVLHRDAPPAAATAAVEPTEIAAVFTAITALPQRINKAFSKPDARPIEADPLSRELDNVKADARSALHFLAESFLPAAPAEPTSSLQDRQPALLGS